MTRPIIRFLRQTNGQRLAYATHGSGPMLVCPAWWVSHLEEDWEDPGFRSLFGCLAEHHTVVRYDRPGAGLSDRTRGAIDLDGEVATLTELVDHLDPPNLSLFAFSCAGPTALVYAATHPARVSSLVFFGSFLRGADVGSTEMKEALQGLVRVHWGMGSRAITNLFAPDLPDSEVKRLDRRYRQTATPEMAAELLGLTFEMNGESIADTMNTPALVLHRKGDKTIRHEAGRELASSLPNATFETLGGSAHVPWLGDVSGVCDAVLGFLGSKSRQHETGDENALRKNGDVWTVTFNGRSAHVKHARGITDVAILVASAGREIHVGKLWSGADSAAALGGETDPILDDDALASYRTRFRELEAAIAEAEEFGKTEVVEGHIEERELLARELRAAVGLGGRKRGLAEPSERARKAVTARIRASIKKIEAVHPELGSHLGQCITTGTYCTYEQPPGVEWVVTHAQDGPLDSS